MGRHSHHTVWHRTAAGLAAAALATLGLAGTAHAADAPLPVTFIGPDTFNLSLSGDNGEPTEPNVELGLKGPGTYDPDAEEGPDPVHTDGYKVTIDASALAGFAKVELPCEAEGLIAVCTEDTLYPGEGFNRGYDLRVDITDKSKAGDFGKIKVTGEGEGLTFTEHTVDVLVGGPEFLMRKLPAEPKGFAAGDTYRAPLGFRNVGSMAADGVVLQFSGSRGLSFPTSYENCEYALEDEGNLIRQRQVALCTFEGTYEAGQAYELSEQLGVKTAAFAHHDIFGYWFSAVAPKHAEKLRAGSDYRSGTGGTLRLQPAKDTKPGDYTQYAERDLPRNNTHDLDLIGDRVSGAKGARVKVNVRLENNGPAWLGSLRAGGEPLAFTVKVPKGSTVTKSPERCNPMNTETGPDKSTYLCWAGTPLLEDDKRSFPFELRIDKVVKGAKGKIALPEWEDPYEGKPANDDGWIVLNGTGDEETPGDIGGTSGGTGGTGGTGGSTGGSTGGEEAQSTGGSSGGSDATGGSTGGGSTEGGLASTGSMALLTAGGAAAALAAGGVLFVVARRRRTARGDLA